MTDDSERLVPARLRRTRRKRGRKPVDALAHEGLFLLLTTLRAANAESLCELFFKKQQVANRTGKRRLKDLVAAGYLAHVRLDGARQIYHLTAKALALTERLQLRAYDTLCVPPADRQAMYCWLRSALWASLSADGYTVGQSGDELHMVRRLLVDSAKRELAKVGAELRADHARVLEELRTSTALKVPVCDACTRCPWRGSLQSARERCPSCHGSTKQAVVQELHRCRTCGAVIALPGAGGAHVEPLSERPCTGKLREIGVVPYDVAWRIAGGRLVVALLFVDNPSRSIEAQVDELPIVCFGQARIPVVLRATDPHSSFDREAMVWATVGRRHAEVTKAFGEKGLGESVMLVEHAPKLQAYFVR